MERWMAEYLVALTAALTAVQTADMTVGYLAEKKVGMMEDT
jgi:hypothetical protein